MNVADASDSRNVSGGGGTAYCTPHFFACLGRYTPLACVSGKGVVVVVIITEDPFFVGWRKIYYFL